MPFGMRDTGHSIRRALPAALAVLLLLVAIFAATLPHSHHGNSETTCQICHFSHQPAEQHLCLSSAAAPVPLGIAPLAAEPARTVARSLSIRISRAPPLV